MNKGASFIGIQFMSSKAGTFYCYATTSSSVPSGSSVKTSATGSTKMSGYTTRSAHFYQWTPGCRLKRTAWTRSRLLGPKGTQVADSVDEPSLSDCSDCSVT